MENYEMQIADLLEVETINMSDDLDSFDTWDSLTILGIISLCMDEYKIILNAEEIKDSKTVAGLKSLIESRKN